MLSNILFISIVAPAIFGIYALLVPARHRGFREAAALAGAAFNLWLAISLFGKIQSVSTGWLGYGIDFALRLDHFSSFILLASAGFGLLVTLYSFAFMKDRAHTGQYYAYVLFSLAMVNGAVLADNLAVLLFFWEGLLGVLFGMIIIGRPQAWRTAVKALIICGVADLIMMLGIALVYGKAGTLTISTLNIPLAGMGTAAFLCLMTGAVAKAGSMPFHSWIPDAALDAPLPFMALIPAALEKLLGIYFLSRLTLEIFKLSPHSWVSVLMMTLGVCTILLAVMMALVQKNYKKLLSYHAISQVGYMILGIGTAVPAGIVGGIFHMINHAMYKSTLFLTGGAVEKQAGTTDLEKLGGLARSMPVTFACFVIAAAAISGVPPLNGFFSKELVYDGALERHWIFYAGALLGSFLTAASFLKLGHAAFFGKKTEQTASVKEAPWTMLVPMISLAGLCVLFGVYNRLPLERLIQPILGEHLLEGRHFWGMPSNMMLIALTALVLAAAVINHLYGVKRSGRGLGAADHIHYAPGLAPIYERAEQRAFDPYDIGMALTGMVSRGLFAADRVIDRLYDVVSVRAAYALAQDIRAAHTGNYSLYIIWAVAGLAGIVIFMLQAL